MPAKQPETRQQQALLKEESMRWQDDRLHGKALNTQFRFRDRLVYIPGAVILVYGFWLSLTA